MRHVLDDIPDHLGALSPAQIICRREYLAAKKTVIKIRAQGLGPPFNRRRLVRFEVDFIAHDAQSLSDGKLVDGDEIGVRCFQIAEGPEHDRLTTIQPRAQAIPDLRHKGQIKRDLPRLDLALQCHRRRRPTRLADEDALILQPHGGAHDTAVTEILLCSQQTIHAHGDKAAQGKERALALGAPMPQGLEVALPRTIGTFFRQKHAARGMKVIHELPRSHAVIIHDGRVFIRAVEVAAILFPHHVERLHTQGLTDVGLGR